jgi:DNA processing protein
MDIFRAGLDDLVGVLAGSRLAGDDATVSERFGNAERSNAAKRSSAAECDRVRKLAAVWSGRNLGKAESVLTNHGGHAIDFVCAVDPQYRDIFEADIQAPLVLYYRGHLAPRGVPVVGVIGSRSCSSYGRMVTRVAVGEMVDRGQVITSGLSFGIDAIAHETALACEGVSYAFLPCGLHKAHPAAHTALMERIADTGAVISPYPYGTESQPFRFIHRNRVLATWCDTLLVIEARIDSGSMRTGRAALLKGKPVLAVPNSLLDPRSQGTNQLLAEGARVYLTDRLLQESGLESGLGQVQGLAQVRAPVQGKGHAQGKGSGQDLYQPACNASMHDAQASIVEALCDRAMTTSEIVSVVRGGTAPVMECLSEMELADKLEFRSDGRWHLSGGL